MRAFPDIALPTVSEWSGIVAKKGMSVVLTQRGWDAALVKAEARLRTAGSRMTRARRESAGTRTQFLATVLLGVASTSGRHSALVDDGVAGFLLALVVLLALAIVAIIRLRPLERASSSDDEADQSSRALPAAARSRGPVPAPRLVAPVSGPQVSGRPDSRGYAPRHVPRKHAEVQVADRPQVSGGPPWGPAPRPPGLG